MQNKKMITCRENDVLVPEFAFMGVFIRVLPLIPNKK